jgi:hypothetical protein
MLKSMKKRIMNLEELNEHKKKNKVKRHKFKAVRCESDGIKFPSLLEARYYAQLKLREKAGEILFFLRQTPFHLPGGVKYVVDFVVFYENGDIEFIDTKGKDTALSIAKRKMVEDLYPIEIKIVKA